VKGSTVLAKFAQYARDARGAFRWPQITGFDRAPRITVNTEALLQMATSR